MTPEFVVAGSSMRKLIIELVPELPKHIAEWAYLNVREIRFVAQHYGLFVSGKKTYSYVSTSLEEALLAAYREADTKTTLKTPDADLSERIKKLEDALQQIKRICNPYILPGDDKSIARAAQAVEVHGIIHEALRDQQGNHSDSCWSFLKK